MNRISKFFSGLGCLVSIAGPLLAVLFYPRAKWLFALVLIGFVVIIVNEMTRKDPTPQALADEIENLMTGNYWGWDVDDFEHIAIRDPKLREFWRKSMSVGGLPEEWVRLSEEGKNQMREIISELRKLGNEEKGTG